MIWRVDAKYKESAAVLSYYVEAPDARRAKVLCFSDPWDMGPRYTPDYRATKAKQVSFEVPIPVR